LARSAFDLPKIKISEDEFLAVSLVWKMSVDTV
jgi:hypothetical protein